MKMALKQKKRLHKILDDLAKALRDCQESIAAIDILREKVNELPEDPSLAASPLEIGHAFPLPAEIQHPHQMALFSDGACRGNPGPGSWGAIGQNFTGEILFESSGLETHTTNNRMELTGAIQSLLSLKNVLSEKRLLAEHTEVYLYTDSNLVAQGVNQWMEDWKRRNWKKADGKDVANIDLWKELGEVITEFKSVELCWVKGHAGHPQNERCDQLANNALDDSGF